VLGQAPPKARVIAYARLELPVKLERKASMAIGPVTIARASIVVTDAPWAHSHFENPPAN
jgi:hypothetical protein